MRLQHTVHNIPAFPINSSGFLSDNELVLGGGGGSSKSGIKNKLRFYTVVPSTRHLEQVEEYQFGQDEDAPMSLAISQKDSTLACGVNSVESLVEKGQNENVRVFNIANREISPLKTFGTLNSGDVMDYQKVTSISQDGTRLVVAGSNMLNVLSYPDLTPLAVTLHSEKEIYDATFTSDGSSLLVTTTSNLLLYKLPEGSGSELSPPTNEKGKAKAEIASISELELVHSSEVPQEIGGPTGGTFRAGRFSTTSDNIVYTVINTSPKRSKSSKSATRHAYVCRWDVKNWTVEKTRKVGDKGLTCFSVSPNGKLLGIGLSDLSISLLDATTLAPVATIFQAHDFPPTTLSFNPSTTLLISGSLDTVRVITIPDEVEASFGWMIYMIMAFAFIALCVARVVQKLIILLEAK